MGTYVAAILVLSTGFVAGFICGLVTAREVYAWAWADEDEDEGEDEE